MVVVEMSNKYELMICFRLKSINDCVPRRVDYVSHLPATLEDEKVILNRRFEHS